MFLSRGQFGFLSIVPPEESLALVGAIAALVDELSGAEFALSTGVGEEAIEYWAVFLHENSAADELMAMEGLVRKVIAAGSDGFLSWADWAYATADRFALSVAQDLSVAIKSLKSESDSSRGVAVTGAQTFRQLLENEPALARLHNFAFSAPFLGLGEDRSTAAPSDIEVSAPGTENAGAEPLALAAPTDDDVNLSDQSAVATTVSKAMLLARISKAHLIPPIQKSLLLMYPRWTAITVRHGLRRKRGVDVERKTLSQRHGDRLEFSM